MATYDDVYHVWRLGAAETDFAMPTGTTTNRIEGNALANRLTGDDGNNVIDGIAGEADTLVGGLGNDTYQVQNPQSVVVELSGQGNDLISLDPPDNIHEITYIIPDNVERCILVNHNQSIDLTGNSLDNTIYIDGLSSVLDVITIDGGAGADTVRFVSASNCVIIVDNVGDAISVNQSSADRTILVQSSVSYTLPVRVQNLSMTGSGAIDGTGNDLDNTLVGNGNGNLLSGLAGNDTLRGGDGDDILRGGEGSNILEGGAGADTIDGAGGTSTASFLHAPSGVKVDLRSTDGAVNTGDAAGDHLVAVANLEGSAFADILIGNDSDNRLIGGAGDALIGGLGNDVYALSHANAVVTEAAGAGTDAIVLDTGSDTGAVVFRMAANVENFTFVSHDQDLNLVGNDLANTITINSGNSALGQINVIDGGAGGDLFQLQDSANYTIIIDDTADQIDVSAVGPYTVLAKASVSYTLVSGVQDLTLTGTDAINGTGNAGDNTLDGNGSANILTGLAGNDTLRGGAGDDRLVGGAGTNILDGGAGADTLDGSGGSSTASYLHAASAVTVDLRITDGSANRGDSAGDHIVAIDAIEGSAFDDVLTGNASANLLTGGDGADTLRGGAGNDTLDGGGGSNTAVFSGTRADYTVVENTDGTTTVTDNRSGGDGTDLLKHLTALHFETSPPVTIPQTQPTPLILRGTSHEDNLRGNDGNDKLYGKTGKDILTGGAGKDVFVFDTKLSKANLDKITDFSVADDSIWLDNALFKASKAFYGAIKKGTEAHPLALKSAYFRVSPAAKDADDHIIYNKFTGLISYDPDGSGAKAAIAIAHVSKNLALTSGDLFII